MIVYLASPYTAYKDGRDKAYELACKAQAHLMNRGFNVFCPIAHTHTAGEMLKESDHEFWMQQDRPFMDLCHLLIVVTMDGWKESRGVMEEIETFRLAGKPILYMDPIE